MKQLYVIGWPIKHSRSPLIHNHWIKHYGLDAQYQAKQIEPEALQDFIQTLTPDNCLGFNITIPHKEAVFAAVKNRNDLAQKLRATNCISWQDNALLASNTDGYGFYKNLIEVTDWQQTEQPVIIYGAGGAARAILQVMSEQGAKHIYIYNRTIKRAETLCADLNIDAAIIKTPTELNDVLNKAGLLINTTSLGMHGQPPLEINLSKMQKSAIIADIIYTPLKTDLLKQAEQLGLKHVDGLGMLLHQAAKAFEIWFDILPNVDQRLRELLISDLVAKGEA